MNKRRMICACLVLSLCAPALNAAYIYDFQIFNDIDYQNNPDLDFTVEVWDLAGQAIFEFRNNSTINSVITEIYFDDDSLLELDHIENYIIDADNRIGTTFSSDRVNPGNLPGANLLTPRFQANPLLSVQPCCPAPKWGIGQGQQLQLVFNLTDGHLFSDVITAMNSQMDLRIGMHIQCLGPAAEDSASAISVPEPTVFLLLSFGALILRKRH